VQTPLGWRAWCGGAQDDDLVLVAGRAEDLEVQGEVADDQVVVLPGATGHWRCALADTSEALPA
jgi:hypothetical protein